MRYCYRSLAIVAALLMLSAWLPGGSEAAWIDLGGQPFAVDLVSDDGERSVIEITLDGFDAEAVVIEGETYYQINLAGEGRPLEAGLPDLPNVRRALIIPDDREMSVRVLESEYVDVPDMPVAPSKGNLPRTVDPATVEYTFAPFYAGNDVYPVEAVTADPPHIVRDYRGLVVDANVFQYLPATQTLRVATRLLIEVAPVGPGSVNVLQRSGPIDKLDPQFAGLYENHFLNYATDRYDMVYEDGSLLIITHDSFLTAVEPLLEWKLQKGIATQMVPISAIGSSYSQIAAYIQNLYDSSDLAYVLLVGDAAQIPTYGSTSDPQYSLVAGSDNYPDIFIGRFSAENANHVLTQVERTIAYERDTQAVPVWPQYGTGIASNQGPGHFGEYDNQHMDLIRADLLGYGYLGVDQIYDPSASAAMVTNALNEGRGIVNYCGHGSTTSWGSSGFSSTHVNNLVNDGMLPFISSVACLNGNFTTSTCFGEAWLRATNNGQPTGAIACYMSKISQSWDPPMYAQDEAIDLLIADQMRTVGGLWFNGSCEMMDATGASGVTEFLNWTIFGDPSLAVRTKQAESLSVADTGVLLIGQDTYEVTVAGVEGALCALYGDGVLYGCAVTGPGGMAQIVMADPPTDVMNLTLTVTAYNAVTHQSEVPVLPPEGPYLVFEACSVLDAAGDDDGILDGGEAVELHVVLENVGVDETTGVTAMLTTEDEFVTVAVNEAAFPDIAAGAMAGSLTPFGLEVAGHVPDGHVVQLTLTATGTGGIWTVNFFLPVQAPVLATAGATVDDDAPGGDGSGDADAGETIALTINLANSGHSAAGVLNGWLESADPNVSVSDPDGSCDGVPVDGVGELSGFSIEIAPGCPEPSHLMFYLYITGEDGFLATLVLELPVGGWFDDLESDRGWSVGFAGDDASSGIWERVDPIGTSYNGHVIQTETDHTVDPGVNCFVTGNGSAGGTAGENDVDGGRTTLCSPIFDLSGATSATVSYWRWYTNSWGNNPDSDWWDVEVTNDGLTWVSLEHTQETEAAWVEKIFELAGYIALTDHVQIRFVAADEGESSLVEAGVDDFYLDVVHPSSTPVDDGDRGLPARLALNANFPNPFNPRTNISFDLPRTVAVELAVFDLKGRKVVTLVNEELPAGSYELPWFGRDDNDHQVASGIYFYRLTADSEVLTRKMTLLK